MSFRRLDGVLVLVLLVWVKRGGDIQGQPQCRRNETTTGLPSLGGMVSFSSDGALVPIAGAGETGLEVGDGVSQDWSSCWKVMLGGWYACNCTGFAESV